MSAWRQAFEEYITRGDNPKYEVLKTKNPINNHYVYVDDEWKAWKAAIEWYCERLDRMFNDES